MAEELLGPVFEIHGGGLDLVFPHHENELAQSSALDHEFARIWTHNGILRFTDEKMSKSLGNVVTMDEALDQRGRETLLLMFLGAHWRKPMDFSEETLQQAAARAEGFREVFRNPSEPAPEGVGPVHGRARRRLQHARRSRDHARMAQPRSGTPCARAFGLGALAETQEAPTEVVDLARRRQQARADRDFGEADRLHGEIESEGWIVRDVDDGFRLVPR